MHVGQLMTRGPKSCGPNDSLSRAAEIMWENDCGCAPVIDGEGRAIAMITDRDVCMAAYTQGKPLSHLRVSSAASRKLVSVREEDPIDNAERLMQTHQIRRLPVIDNKGRPVGILSMNDISRRASDGGWRGELNAETVARTLAAVGVPRAHAVAAE